MHSSGYEAAHFPAEAPEGGGGGWGGPTFERQAKPSTGCSSIAFGATPVWPWL